MRSIRVLFVMASLWVVTLQGVGYAENLHRLDGGSCQPGLNEAFRDHAAAYTRVYNAVFPRLEGLTRRLKLVTNQETYESLLTAARTVAGMITNGRLVITLPDGTVVVDTARNDDPTNILPQGNSYQHFIEKTVNENHNSRIAIFSAQQYPCGVGIESKFSTTTGNHESYVALRLGTHLDSEGTVRGSTF